MTKVRHGDKLLPNQAYFRDLYRGTVSYEEAMYLLSAAYAQEFSASQFDLKLPETISFEEMSTPPSELAVFNAVAQLIGAKTVLEIGTFIGHSAMHFAQMVGRAGHVTTIEIGKEFADIARANFQRNGFSERITLLEGNAGAILTRLPKMSFDLVFVDGSKQDYLEYALLAEKLITERGVIIVDDVFFHGDALNDVPATEKGQGCKRLLDHYRDETKLIKLLLPVANGILLLSHRRPANRG